MLANDAQRTRVPGPSGQEGFPTDQADGTASSSNFPRDETDRAVSSPAQLYSRQRNVMDWDVATGLDISNQYIYNEYGNGEFPSDITVWYGDLLDTYDNPPRTGSTGSGNILPNSATPGPITTRAGIVHELSREKQ